MVGATTTTNANIYMRLYTPELLVRLEQVQARTLPKIEESESKSFGAEGRLTCPFVL